MPKSITYTQAKNNFDQLFNQVLNHEDVVVIEREDGQKAVIMTVDELESMQETLYLLQSPENANRIHTAVAAAKAGNIKSQTVDELFKELEN